MEGRLTKETKNVATERMAEAEEWRPGFQPRPRPLERDDKGGRRECGE